MAYSTSNPPRLAVQPLTGKRIWQYESADTATNVDVPGYFTNGKDLGMKVNDIVEVIDTTTPLISTHRVNTVNATTGQVTISTAVTVGNTADGT